MNAMPQSLDDRKELYDVVHYVEGLFHYVLEGGSGSDFIGNIIPFDDAVVFAHLLRGRDAFVRFRDFPGIPFRRIYDMDRAEASSFQESLETSTSLEFFRRAQQAVDAIGAAQRAMVSAIRERMNGINLDYGSNLGPENLASTWHQLSAEYSALRYLIPELLEAVGEQEQRQWFEVKHKLEDAILAFRESFDWDQVVAQGPEASNLIIKAPGSEFQAHLVDLRGLLSKASLALDTLREELMKRVAEFLDYGLADYLFSEEGTSAPVSTGLASRP